MCVTFQTSFQNLEQVEKFQNNQMPACSKDYHLSQLFHNY